LQWQQAGLPASGFLDRNRLKYCGKSEYSH
jgi:hypothetical protein